MNLNRTFIFRLEVIFITSCNLCFCITQSIAKGLFSPGIVLRDHCWHADSRDYQGCWEFNMGWPYIRQAPTVLSLSYLSIQTILTSLSLWIFLLKKNSYWSFKYHLTAYHLVYTYFRNVPLVNRFIYLFIAQAIFRRPKNPFRGTGSGSAITFKVQRCSSFEILKCQELSVHHSVAHWPPRLYPG